MDEEKIQTIIGALTKAISFWETKRDREFSKAGFDREKVYEEGNFDELPYDCVEAVHYADAYKSIKKNIEDIVEG